MLERLEKIIRMEDKRFSLYQFPLFVYIKYGDLAYDVVDDLKFDNYMGLRESWELIDRNDIENMEVNEWGCNVGSTSYNILQMNPKVLHSFDYSPKSIEFCNLFVDMYEIKNWLPEIGNIKTVGQICDVSVWEDPHTDIDEEIKLMLVNVVKNTRKVVYFLECDNIEHIIRPMFGDSLKDIGEDSWKVVL